MYQRASGYLGDILEALEAFYTAKEIIVEVFELLVHLSVRKPTQIQKLDAKYITSYF